MKKVITIILVLILYPGILSKGMPDKIYFNKETFSDDVIYLDPDTGSVNPFLNINKWELDILTPSSGIQVYGNGILYLSLSKRERNMISEHVSFGDMKLVFAPVNDSVPGEPVIFNLSRQIAIPAEGITITDDHSGFYYSKLSERDGKVKIYRTKYSINDGLELWEINDEALSFCKDNYNYTHPAISREGNIMIFSSDMPGSTGDLDLYISRYENNAWTEPENMGKKFNSTGSELYAYLDRNNNLYYSSDGLPGMGGFDIFLSNYNGSGWDDPVNLYDQINTSNDEVAFKTNREGKNLGFYTMIIRSGFLNKKMKRELYKVELSNKYDNNSYLLVDVLRNYALESPLLAMDNAEKKLEEERFTEAQMIADSLRTEETSAERLAAEQREAERLAEQQRKTEEKRVADSLRAEQLRAEQLKKEEQSTDKVVYKIQFLSSMKSVNPRTIVLNGVSYQTSEYFYNGAWRITLGEFENIDNAVRVRRLLNEEGYDQAFVAVFVNGERSLDMQYFQR